MTMTVTETLKTMAMAMMVSIITYREYPPLHKSLQPQAVQLETFLATEFHSGIERKEGRKMSYREGRGGGVTGLSNRGLNIHGF